MKEQIEIKLKLWQTPGFYQFINDLEEQKGVECGIKQEVEILRRMYIKKMEELTKSKWKQLKIKGL